MINSASVEKFTLHDDRSMAMGLAHLVYAFAMEREYALEYFIKVLLMDLPEMLLHVAEVYAVENKFFVDTDCVMTHGF